MQGDHNTFMGKEDCYMSQLYALSPTPLLSPLRHLRRHPFRVPGSTHPFRVPLLPSLPGRAGLTTSVSRHQRLYSFLLERQLLVLVVVVLFLVRKDSLLRWTETVTRGV